MAGIGLDLNFQAGPPKACRVSLNPPCESNRKGIVEQGNQTYMNPGGVIYREYGVLAVNDAKGLGVYQQRPFITPEYYNGGCFGLYCRDSTECPLSTGIRTSPQTKSMFDRLFYDTDPYTGNGAPPSCFQGKQNWDGTGATYNSVRGWEMNKQGVLAFALPGADVEKLNF